MREDGKTFDERLYHRQKYKYTITKNDGVLETTAEICYTFCKWVYYDGIVKYLQLDIPKDTCDASDGPTLEFQGKKYHLGELLSWHKTKEEATETIIERAKSDETSVTDRNITRIFQAKKFRDYLEENPHLLL